MKNTLKYILPFLLLLACTENKENSNSPDPLFPQPETIKVDTKHGYTLNSVTGDSINPIILESGDTLITGVPIPAKGKVINSDSVAKPQVFIISKKNQLITKKAHLNKHNAPSNLSRITINQDSLIIVSLAEITKQDTSHYFINRTADTVKTGVPITLVGEKVKSTQAKITKALSPKFKDASNTNLKFLDVDQGLASSYIYSILEDSRGNLWFGTEGGGVSCYDGESFSHYTNKNGLSNNIVMSIIEDKSGNIWFGTYGGGVNCYDGENFIHYTEKEGFSSNIVLSILEDRKGNLWFGTDGGGVSCYDGKQFVHYTKKEGLSNNTVRSILEDKGGNLWFGTKGGVNRFDGKSFVHYTKKSGLSNNLVYSMIEDKNGNIWFGTIGGGVIRYDGERFENYTVKEGLSNNVVMSMLEDRSGNIWFGTDAGACFFDGKSFTHYTTQDGLSNDVILSMLEDKSGNIWFGTFGGGVSCCNVASFVHYTDKEGLSNNVVMSMIEDKRGDFWFGTYGGGVNRYDGENFIYYPEKEGFSNNIILSMLEDKSGNLWFGTYDGGVSCYDGKNFLYYTEKEGLSHNTVTSLLEDKKGDLWFGTDGGGVSRYDGKNFIHYTEKEGLSSNAIMSMIEDKSGNIWFGGSAGVSRYDGKSFTHYTEKEGLSDNGVTVVFEDKEGYLWFGTYAGGVNCFDGENFVHYTEKEGLSNNCVYSIFEDKRGNIWVGTELGLNEFFSNEGSATTQKEKQDRLEIRQYLTDDGLKGLNFYSSALIDHKNRAWWGTGKSLTTLDLNTHTITKNSPKVFLKQLDINDQFIDYHNLPDSMKKGINFDGVKRFQEYPLNLELAHNKNHLTFHYVAIDWSAPNKIKYSYRLKGLNSKWSIPTTETKANYTNLPHGTFTFEVKAIGSSQEWSESVNYIFTITLPWWRTWWAKILFVIAGILFIYSFVKWRTAQLKARQKELETEVAKATKDLKDKNNEIEKQKEEVEKAHKNITDSINYAERIQRSFLATEELLNKNLDEYFVYFNPREIVSGDFYWAGKLSNGNFAMVNADSTGHGVPGAIMSMLNVASIEKAIEKGETCPAEIFNQAREIIIERLKSNGGEDDLKDGMDASFISFNSDKTKIFYVAAQSTIWIVRDNELIEIKPEKMPVGKYVKDHIPFKGGEYNMQKGDLIYTMTDGFADQFGGLEGKKFMVKNMREYILSISNLPMSEQHTKLAETFSNWKGDTYQVDDVCVIGVRI